MAQETIQLFELAHGRSGDKGNSVNIGIIARDEQDFELLVQEVTVERVAKQLGGFCKGKIERYLMPNISAMNFLCHEALDGGGTQSLRIDSQGKTLVAAILQMEIPKSSC